MYRRHVKRPLDVLGGLLGLLAASPLLVIGALSVRLTSRGPVRFHQERVGLHGQTFRIVKLRTMYVDEARSIEQTVGSSSGVTPVGRLLRRLKIDELPQLINVVRGDMSLVGPRPCLPETCADMPQWARARFTVRPGLTGLAQVNGNIALSWEERWRFDVEYSNSIRLVNDARIILKTLAVLALGEQKFRSVT